jgi:hypothetical protein
MFMNSENARFLRASTKSPIKFPTKEKKVLNTHWPLGPDHRYHVWEIIPKRRGPELGTDSQIGPWAGHKTTLRPPNLISFNGRMKKQAFGTRHALGVFGTS